MLMENKKNSLIPYQSFILVREKKFDIFEKRIFVRFEKDGVVCQNIWRPEKEVFWEEFELIEKVEAH